MQARSALVAAIVCGALADGVVAADVAWSLQAIVQAPEDGDWRTIAAAPHDPYGHDDVPRDVHTCPGPQLRLIVDNDRPIGAKTDILVTYANQSTGRPDVILRDSISLSPFTSQTFDLTVPPSAFPQTNDTDPRNMPYGKEAGIQVHVGDLALWVSVCAEGSA